MSEYGRIIWQPQAKQVAFMERPEFEALYGGAAGGGKSDALLAEALRQVHIPHYRALILRKTYKQLSELIDRSRAIYGAAYPGARYNTTAHCWTFPSGAIIFFGNMQHSSDVHNYQGKRYNYIAFDELTHFTWEEYSYMFSRCRPSGYGARGYIRATTNPGGIGHGWVKDRFISAAPPMTPIWSDYSVRAPGGEVIGMRRDRIFVPATVFDNSVLLAQDPGYLASLSMMPEADRQALLYGDWDSFSGQVFREWRNDPRHYEDRLWTHVIAPFRIPAHWRVYRGFDFGYAKPFSVGWYAVDEVGRIYRVAEYYGTTGTPDEGIKIDPTEIAARIKQIESEHDCLKGRQILGVADPSIYDESRGESIAAMMGRSPHFVYFDRGDNTRLAGKMQLHYRLAFDERGQPMMYVFDVCKHFIRTIPALVYDETHVEDVNTKQEDHIYDECRYVLMANPIKARVAAKPEDIPEDDDPLNMRRDMLFWR